MNFWLSTLSPEPVSYFKKKNTKKVGQVVTVTAGGGLHHRPVLLRPPQQQLGDHAPRRNRLHIQQSNHLFDFIIITEKNN